MSVASRLKAFGPALGSLVMFTAMGIGGTSWAQEFKHTILTGSPSGTYIKIGEDIRKLGAECGLDLNVTESAGSLANFMGVRQRRFTQFGIVQSDVLEYFKTYESGRPEVRAAIRGVRSAFPLYNEEVHILASTAVRSLDELDGKRVAVGKKDSGTFLTASLVLDIAGVKPSELINLGAGEALAELVAGRLDALFYVAGVPAGLFDDESIDPKKLHLLPITESNLLATYVPAVIPSGAYPWLDKPVSVIAVKAVLMTYEYDPNKNDYLRKSCKAVSDYSHLIVRNFGRLKREGHKKWNDVDLLAVLPGWAPAQCVEAGLSPDYEVDCGSSASDVYKRRIEEMLRKQ